MTEARDLGMTRSMELKSDANLDVIRPLSVTWKGQRGAHHLGRVDRRPYIEIATVVVGRKGGYEACAGNKRRRHASMHRYHAEKNLHGAKFAPPPPPPS